MNKFKKVGIVLSAALLLVGCGGGKTETSQDDVKDFNFIVRLTGDPTNFNPNFKSDDYAWPVNQNIYNRLVKLNANDQVIPDLAESYEYSEDGMKLTFKLKENVKWHDGTEFSSADVKWTYDTMMAENWSKSDSLMNVESIDTPDKNTVVMNLKNKDAVLISKLGWYGTFIMPKHIYEGSDVSTNEANQNPIGTGPFKFSSWEKGVSVKLTRNDEFFGEEKASAKELTFMIIPDDNTAYQALVNNEIDYMNALPVAEVDSLDNDENYKIVQTLGINRSYMTFNFNNEHLAKKEVREAIAMGLDQKVVYDRVGGAGEMATTFISPVFDKFVDSKFSLPKTDVEGAQKKLEDAGYTKNSNGYYLELELALFESGNFKDTATILQANLDKIGIKINLEVMEMSAWQQKVMENKDFELTMLAGYQGPDVTAVSGRVSTTGSTNFSGYSNEKLDKLFNEASGESEESKRIELVSQIQEIMSEDLPIVPILDNGYKYAIKVEFDGIPIQVPEKAASGEYTYVKKVK